MVKTKKIKEPEAFQQPEAKFEMLSIDRIFPDDNQPRKFFDELALSELVESVRANGILQPIMVRPSGEILSPAHLKGPKYSIVCGERRYRAAEAVNMRELPVIIRDLDDDQALEIQIVENLQRKDVNPMEEALAFVNLKEHGFSIEEIGLKVGKPPAFVAQRMKLADLVDSFQELVYAGKMTLSTAFKICRYSPDTQLELYKEARVPKDWQKKKNWELQEFYGLDSKGIDLDEASFKTEDAELYPEAGPCNNCPHNSAANKLLFPEMKRERICHNAACYAIKAGRAYTKTIEAALTDPDMLFISADTYPSKESKAKIKAVQDMGAVVLESDQFEFMCEPDQLQSYEEYLEEQKSDIYDDVESFDELPAAKQKQYLKEWKEEYAGMVDEDKAEWKEYNDAKESGAFKKAFVVTGSWRAAEGTIAYVKLKTSGKKIDVPAGASEDMKALAREQEIQGIREREKRNKELDREKVYNRAMEELKPMYTAMNDQLHPEELQALAVLLMEVSYTVSNEFDKSNDYSRIKFLKKLTKGEISENDINRMVRFALYDKLVNKNTADPERHGTAGAMMSVASVFIPDQLALFTQEQKEKAAKRMQNVNKRISALESNIQ